MYRNVVIEMSPDRNGLTEVSCDRNGPDRNASDRNGSDQKVLFRKCVWQHGREKYNVPTATENKFVKEKFVW